MSDRRAAWPEGHVVHMSLDHSAPERSISIAECDCGWKHRIAWRPGAYRRLDKAIERHWRDVEKP